MTASPPNLRRPFLAFVALSFIFLTLFAAWSTVVFTYPPIAAFDLHLAETFSRRSTDSPMARPIMVAATHSGGIRANVILAVAGAFWMWHHHRRRFAIAWLLIALGGGIIILELKESFGRDRPPTALRDAAIEQTNESYPSGHAMGSLVGYGMVAFVLAQRAKKWPTRILIVASLAAWVALIGFSRVYLRAHWASDIIGGWLLGLAYVNVCLSIYYWRRAKAET